MNQLKNIGVTFLIGILLFPAISQARNPLADQMVGKYVIDKSNCNNLTLAISTNLTVYQEVDTDETYLGFVFDPDSEGFVSRVPLNSLGEAYDKGGIGRQEKWEQVEQSFINYDRGCFIFCEFWKQQFSANLVDNNTLDITVYDATESCRYKRAANN